LDLILIVAVPEATRWMLKWIPSVEDTVATLVLDDVAPIVLLVALVGVIFETVTTVSASPTAPVTDVLSKLNPVTVIVDVTPLKKHPSPPQLHQTLPHQNRRTYQIHLRHVQ